MIQNINEVKPLLKGMNWCQFYPFNALTPKFDYTNSKGTFNIHHLIGCGALSVGQIIYYWGIKGYKRGYGKIDKMGIKQDAIDEFEYDNIKLEYLYSYGSKQYNGRPYNDENRSLTKSEKSVAKLLICPHVGLGSNYRDEDGVGRLTTAPVSNLKSFFKEMNFTPNYNSRADLHFHETKIVEYLQKGVPSIVVVALDDGDLYNQGGTHMFIVDGYKKENGIYLFHFNLGGFTNDKTYNDRYATIDKLTNESNVTIKNMISVSPEPYEYEPYEYESINYGDVNQDSVINDEDIIQAVKNIKHVQYVEEGDINKDNKLSDSDIELIYEKLDNPNPISTKIKHIYNIKQLVNNIHIQLIYN